MTQSLQFIEQLLRNAGSLVLKQYGSQIAAKRKAEKSQIVTVVDVASEKLIVSAIEKKYPHSSIIAEESGFVKKNNEDVWIVDPIDGTSNFANGLPWFGVMIAHMIEGEIKESGIYLPVSDEMYLAGLGLGAFRNSKQLVVFPPKDISVSLVALGTNGTEESFPLAAKTKLYKALLSKVLNIRSTNSAVDYAYGVEGRIGGLINLENRIWDIAPILPFAYEVGVEASDMHGGIHRFNIDENIVKQNFPLVLGSQAIHQQLLDIITRAIST